MKHNPSSQCEAISSGFRHFTASCDGRTGDGKRGTGKEEELRVREREWSGWSRVGADTTRGIGLELSLPRVTRDPRPRQGSTVAEPALHDVCPVTTQI